MGRVLNTSSAAECLLDCHVGAEKKKLIKERKLSQHGTPKNQNCANRKSGIVKIVRFQSSASLQVFYNFLLAEILLIELCI